MKKALNKNKSVMRKENIPNMLIIFRIILAVAIVVLMLIPFDRYYEIIGEKTYWGDPIYTFKSVLHTESDLTYTNVYLNEIIAGGLFVLACFTDWLDGLIARKKGWVSNFGKVWDPIADKILINSVLVCFAYWKMIPAFIPIIMIARDVAVDATKAMASSKGYVVPANWCGKLKTIVQMLAIVVIFFFFNANYNVVNLESIGQDDRAVWWGIQNLLMYVAAFLSLLSGIIYFIDINKNKKVKHAR